VVGCAYNAYNPSTPETEARGSKKKQG
jgi:hypothetical protein